MRTARTGALRLAGWIGLAALAPNPAGAAGETFVVSYMESLPAREAELRDALRAYARAGRAEPGGTAIVVLERTDKPHHFALLERWADDAARDRHRAAAEPFRASLKPMLTAPLDERPHTGLATGDVRSGAVVVLTHVDVVPDKKDLGIATLNRLADATRTEPGLARFDVLQQNSRPNHFTLAETWADPSALQAHHAAPHVRAFRDEFITMSGSPYDERLYRAME